MPKRIYINHDVELKITRWVKNTESRQEIIETVADALRNSGAGNDFTTSHGTVMVSAHLSDNLSVQVLYDDQRNQCYYVEY